MSYRILRIPLISRMIYMARARLYFNVRSREIYAITVIQFFKYRWNSLVLNGINWNTNRTIPPWSFNRREVLNSGKTVETFATPGGM